VNGQLNELWALIGTPRAGGEEGRGLCRGRGWAVVVVDEEGLAQIAQILAEK